MSDIFHALITAGFGALKATRKALYIKLPQILSLKRVHLNLWGEKAYMYSHGFDDDNNEVCLLNIAVFISYSAILALFSKIQVKPA